MKRPAVDGKRLGQDRPDFFGQQGGRRSIVDRHLKDRELVAAEPGHHITGANCARDSICRLLEEMVADRVPKRVVDVLEPVEVEGMYGE